MLRRRTRIALALAGAGAVLLVASCGSRTGLFGPDQAGLGPSGSAFGEAGPDAPGPPQPVGCTPGRVTFELALTQLMFVLDRSRSMGFGLDTNVAAPDDQQRWRILQRALNRSITSYDQQISMGAKFFPEPSDGTSSRDQCQTDPGVAIAPARGNAAKILSVFDTTEPLGGTPTSEAVRIAADYLNSTRSIARTLVLATDGAPNCNFTDTFPSCVCTSANGRGCNSDSMCLDDVRTIQTIKNVASNQGIPVYVIGLGSLEHPEFLQVLDAMAVAGGRALPGGLHYNIRSEANLDVALASIRDQATRCTYLTPSAPKDPDAITVSIDGTSIPRDQSKQNGWDWINLEFGELAFFGDACRKAQANVSASFVDGVVRCD